VREARRANGERRGEPHRLIVLAGQRSESLRDVDVGGDQHARDVELAQQPGRARYPANVEGIALDHYELIGHHVAPSSASLSASTRPSGGRQAKTPHARPSTTGVSGPVIPRTNRYKTPPRLRSGS
jgi:hypothetical protein